MRTCVIDVGGGYRGVYAAGVLDYCMQNSIQFNVGIGVSAGSANVSSYGAGQYKRNYQFYTEYGLRKEYASIGNFVKKGSFIDLDYVYSTLSNSDGENPLDYAALIKSPMELFVVSTNAINGEAMFFTKSDLYQDGYDVFKASCAIPFVCKPYWIKGVPYYDGAISDPVPIHKAMELGCEKIVVILTRPEDYKRRAEDDEKQARMICKQYPKAAEQLRKRAKKYNDDVALARTLAKEGKVLIVSPKDTCGVDTLTRDALKLKELYKKGYEDAEKIRDFIV